MKNHDENMENLRSNHPRLRMQISVNILTGKIVDVNVGSRDTIQRVKAKIMCAEGILSSELQNAVRMVTARSPAMSNLPPEVFVCVATGEELTYDHQLQSKLVEGVQLKLVVRKRNDELSPEEKVFCDELYAMAQDVVVDASGLLPSHDVFKEIDDNLAHNAIEGTPALTETFYLSNMDFRFDIQIAWGSPIIDRDYDPPILNGRGLVYEARARADDGTPLDRPAGFGL